MLDDLPVATCTFLASIILIVLGYIEDVVGFRDAFFALAAAGGASYGIGVPRNGAGRGVRK